MSSARCFRRRVFRVVSTRATDISRIPFIALEFTLAFPPSQLFLPNILFLQRRRRRKEVVSFEQINFSRNQKGIVILLSFFQSVIPSLRFTYRTLDTFPRSRRIVIETGPCDYSSRASLLSKRWAKRDRCVDKREKKKKKKRKGKKERASLSTMVIHFYPF